MMFKTHIVIAFLIGLIGIKLFQPANQILFMAFVLVGGLLPDIDHPRSKIGRYTPVAYLFEHRGFFHSLFMLPTLGAILLYVAKLPEIVMPKLFGYASHLFSDMMTVEGIMPFHPLSRMRIRGFMKTGGLFEKFLFVFLIILSGYFLFHM